MPLNNNFIASFFENDGRELYFKAENTVDRFSIKTLMEKGVLVGFSGSLSGLADVGPGQLLQRGFILVICQGGIEDVHDVQLRDSGGHGTAAEQ